jgi:hypothetical protein
VAAVAVVMAVAALAALALILPPGFESVRGLNLRAAEDWRARLPAVVARAALALSLDTARLAFRALTVLAWVAYALVVWCVFRGARFGPRWTWPLAVPLALVLGVAMPAVLSTDVFAYVGYGRLAVIHGLNPHLHTQVELVRLGDPTAPYLRWPIASPYGPLWTCLSMAVVRLAPAGAVLGPAIAFKLVAALAVLGVAAGARALVGRVEPERGNATFLLVALNPLLLIEGPGSGHNDVVMIALVVAALVAHAAARPRLAALVVGAAAAVKLVPLVLVPWLAVLAARAAGPRWSSRLAAVGVTTALAVAPLAVAYAPFWEGPRTLGGLQQRWKAGDPPPVVTSTAASPPRTSAGGAATVPRTDETRGRGLLPGLVGALSQAWPALLVLLWATAVMAVGQGDAPFRLATVWAMVSLAIMIFVAGMWFPWYLAWTWPVALLRFTRPHLVLSGFLLPFSLMLMLAYALPPG